MSQELRAACQELQAQRMSVCIVGAQVSLHVLGCHVLDTVCARYLGLLLFFRVYSCNFLLHYSTMFLVHEFQLPRSPLQGISWLKEWEAN